MNPSNIVKRINFTGRKRLPVIRQTEVAECGLACLAMVASYHGHDIDLRYLRQRFPTSPKGFTLTQLRSFAAALSLNSRPVSAPLELLEHLDTPAILHWDLKHFVVLKEVKKKGVVIHDPGRGEVFLPYSLVSNHYTGVAVEVEPSRDFKPIHEKQRISLSSVTGSVRGIGKACIFVLAISLAIEALALILPFYTQLVEPPRVRWRLPLLREWSHEQVHEVFP